MKSSNTISKVIIVLIALIMTSCIDHYQVKTKVMSDGSLVRTISVTGDSSSLFDGRLKVPTDSAWKTTLKWEYEKENDTTSDKRYTYTATRKFKDIQELNNFLEIESDTSKLAKTSIQLKKKFRWFYTFYDYTETYSQRFPFHHYSADQFVSDYELSFFYDDDFTYSPQKDSLIHIKDLNQIPLLTSFDSSRMEQLEDEIMLKIAEWQARNVMEEYLELIAELKDLSSMSDSVKESIYQSSKLNHEFFLDFQDSDEALNNIAHYFSLTENVVKQQLPEKTKVFYKQLEYGLDFIYVHEIRNQLELPGQLINCNADSITASTAYWTFDDNRYYAQDFNMIAESRTINYWAFVLTGILAAILLITITIGAFRR